MRTTDGVGANNTIELGDGVTLRGGESSAGTLATGAATYSSSDERCLYMKTSYAEPTPTLDDGSSDSTTSTVQMWCLYTPNSGEVDLLVAAGWNDEGIGWYGVK